MARAYCSSTLAISIRECAHVGRTEILSCVQSHVFTIAADGLTANVAHVRHVTAQPHSAAPAVCGTVFAAHVHATAAAHGVATANVHAAIHRALPGMCVRACT